MAEVKKARLFLRRGTDTDRKTTTLCDGELGYSTDAFRVVIGDGSTIGGRSLGSTAFISGGALQHSFHTVLTEASAGGYATKGDFAVAPASGYYNAAGAFVNVPDRWATTVMLLTADQVPGSESQSSHNSWVAVNSGIPWGNLNVLDDDISGDKVHAGNISGNVAVSAGDLTIGGQASDQVYLSGVGINAQTVPTGTIIYPLGITSTAEVTAVNSIFNFGTPSVETTGGNNIGHVTANLTTGPLSAKLTDGNVTTNFNVDSYGSTTLNSAAMRIHNATVSQTSAYLSGGAGYAIMGTEDFAGVGNQVKFGTYIINQAACTAKWDVDFTNIIEFYVEFFGIEEEYNCAFLGCHNFQSGFSQVLHFSGKTSHDDRSDQRRGPQYQTITVPNFGDFTNKLFYLHFGESTFHNYTGAATNIESGFIIRSVRVK